MKLTSHDLQEISRLYLRTRLTQADGAGQTLATISKSGIRATGGETDLQAWWHPLGFLRKIQTLKRGKGFWRVNNRRERALLCA